MNFYTTSCNTNIYYYNNNNYYYYYINNNNLNNNNNNCYCYYYYNKWRQIYIAVENCIYTGKIKNYMNVIL